MQRGWLKLWRCSLESEVFQDPELWRFWCWCLLRARYEAEQVQVTVGKQTVTVNLGPGQFAFGRKSAAKELGITPSSALRRLRRLVNLGMLKVDNLEEPDPKATVVSVVNWPLYQEQAAKGGPQADTKEAPNVDTKDAAETPAVSPPCSAADCHPGHQSEPESGHLRSILKKEGLAQAPPAFACPFFSVTQEQHGKHLRAYPGLNLPSEYGLMEAWLEANPTRRKTQRGYPRFVNSWLSRAFKDRQQKEQRGPGWLSRLKEL